MLKLNLANSKLLNKFVSLKFLLNVDLVFILSNKIYKAFKSYMLKNSNWR